jgi:hypothetical protein
MPEQVGSTPITAPTGGLPPVGDPPQQQVAPGQIPPVNVVQAQNPALTPSAGAAIQSGSLSQADVQALTTNWQQRISDLQSMADKRLDERNKAIAAQAQLQQQVTALQEQSSTSLAAAADAAQNAINIANQLKAQVAQLESELRRYKALETHPDLPAQYRKFLPTSGTDEELQAAIAELKAIRDQDLAKAQAGQQPLFTNPAQAPGMQQQVPGTPMQQQPNMLQALYGNRPNMNPLLMGMQNPTLVPGSTPAAMSPAGGGTTTQAISQMLREAMDDPAKYEEAVKRASMMVPQAIQEQLG